MIPILYAKNASVFTNNGIGYLKDAISCKASEERNGEYTLTLTYPITGNYYGNIAEGSVIKAKANETSGLQLFRIYKSSKPLNGVVTFLARHISYDLSGYPVAALSAASTTPGAALTSGFNGCPLTHSFTAWSDITALKAIDIKKPRSLRNLCGGEEGSVISIWGGEFEFDNFVVKLHSARGTDSGVTVDYGKNLTDAKQERNIEDTYTHFCPYAVKTVETKNEAGEIIESHEETVTLPETVIELLNPEDIGHSKALTLDITEKFGDGEEISVENLRTHAEAYIASHSLGKPKVNITFSLLQIWDSPEYASFAALERVRLCDTITVRFPALGINAKAKVIKAEYDSLAERYTKLEVGDAKSTLASTVSSIEESISDTQKSVTAGENAASKALNNAIIEATNKITGNSGGYVVLSPANNPQEILVMNTADKSTATKLWRFNLSGLGYSSTGYSGTYGLALTMDGAIVADFITTGTLRAIDITACTITGGTLNINDKFAVDTDGNGTFEGYVKATSGVIGGCSIVNGVLNVPAANISGTLTALQIDATNLHVAAANIDGTLTASQIDATSLQVAAANITGTLTAAQIDVAGVITAGSIAIQSDIPTATSELANDSGYENTTGVITLIDGRITADYIEALSISVGAAQITGQLTAAQINAENLQVSAANITGTLTIGQLPATVAETSDIPTDVSELINDSGYQTASGVTTIIDGRITADYIEALEISVGAAQISGTLTASQIDATNLHVAAANIDGTLTASQIDATSLQVAAANITGTLTAAQIDVAGVITAGSIAIQSDIPTVTSELTNDSGYENATGVITLIDGRITADYIEALSISVGAAQITGQLTASQINAENLQVSAANITGTLTIGQLPATVAETSDIPTDVSELINDSGYQTASGVTTIIDGRITADYIEALEISVGAAQISGTLTASQIDATNLHVAAANIDGTLTASQINANGITATGVTISGHITATSGSITNMAISGKLTFKNNSAYYIDANMNDSSYYINLPGFKVDDASGAVFSGKLSAPSGNIGGCSIVNGVLQVPAANITGTITAGAITVSGGTNTLLSAGSGAVSIAGWNVDNNSFYSGSTFSGSTSFICTGSTGQMTIAGHTGSGWVLKAGNNFGVNNSGSLYCKSGQIANFTINDSSLSCSQATADDYTSNITMLYGTDYGAYFGALRMGYSYYSSYKSAYYSTFISAVGGIFLCKSNSPNSSSNCIAQFCISQNWTGGERVSLSGSSHIIEVTSSAGMNIRTTTYIQASSSDPISSSDVNFKDNIIDIPESYSTAFDNLRPRLFRWKSGTSGRNHSGFIAQEYKEAFASAGVNADTLGSWCEWDNEEEEGGEVNRRQGIRYPEIIAMCVNEIQKLKARVSELEGI